MTTKININGALEEEACISVLDHGFLFGDSVYEVVATLNSQPVFMNEHLKRLCNSAKELALTLPYSDEKFREEIQKTLDAAGNRESYIRIIVTRGVGEIDLDPVSCLAPTVIILVTESVVYPEESYKKGIHLSLVSVKRNPKEALNPGIKTGNYLNNVLAKIEANRAGAADALMLNPDGILTECTTSNFFLVKEGRVLTPSLGCGILAGITREMVIQLAKEVGLQVEEGEWPPDILAQGEEAFITGTVKKVMPVTFLDGRPIGNGKPGPVTQKLMKLYEEFLRKQIQG